MKLIRQLSLATLIFLASTQAHAASSAANSFSSYNEAWYFMPGAGTMMPDSVFTTAGNGAAFSLAFGRPVSKEWDIQINTNYGHTHEDGLTYQQNTLGVDGLFLFNREQLRPFLLFGGGYQRDRLSAFNRETVGNSPYLEAGLGVQLSLDQRWALQLDFRRQLGFLRNDGFDSNRSRNNYVELGVSYTFD